MPFTMADVTDLSTLSTLDLNDYMVVAVGLDVSKRTTVRTFRRILDKRKKGLKGGKVFERSKARFKFYTTPVCSALETTLKVYELKQQGGKTLWEIGEQANASPMQNVRKDDTKKVAGGKKHKMTVIVRRYLAHANAYLANVVLGLFPKK